MPVYITFFSFENLACKNPFFPLTYLSSNILDMVRASHFSTDVTVFFSQQDTSVVWCCLVNISVIGKFTHHFLPSATLSTY